MFPDLDDLSMRPPTKLAAIENDTQALGFDMPSTRETGSLLRKLASSLPSSRFIELGTGTGLATCWLLDGMDHSSQLLTVDINTEVLDVARRHLGADKRLTIVHDDVVSWLAQAPRNSIDFIFADALPGKFSELDQALSMLSEGGLYVVDDLLPQSNWPEGHALRVPVFINELRSNPELEVDYRAWASGILIAQKQNKSLNTGPANWAG